MTEIAPKMNMLNLVAPFRNSSSRPDYNGDIQKEQSLISVDNAFQLWKKRIACRLATLTHRIAFLNRRLLAVDCACHPRLNSSIANKRRISVSGKSQVDPPKSVAALQAPRCQFIKDDGAACGSAALRNQRWCYFHSRTADGRKRTARTKSESFHVPVLDDARAIQAVASDICRGLVERTLDSRRAKTLLYGLQVASSALRSRRRAISKGADHNMC